MRIGIDISQLAYQNTGVANYMSRLVENMIEQDNENEYVLLFSSLRGKLDESFINRLKDSKVTIKYFKFPPQLLDLIWNKLHIAPIEWFIGNIDIFITSDWTEPPVKNAKKATIIHDLIVFTHPEETDKRIIDVQKSKLKWVKKESHVIFTNSYSTKKDVMKILEIKENKIKVIYPGI